MSDNNLSCCECGIIFGVPPLWERSRRSDGRTFYCPNGHGQHFNQGKSKADQLAEELSRERQRVAERDDEIARQKRLREISERSIRAYRGQVTRLKARTSAGTCPCCNRTFQALARHMATKHPTFRAEAVNEGASA